MRVRFAATALALTGVTVLAVPACSAAGNEAEPGATSHALVVDPADDGRQSAPPHSAALRIRLLDRTDLGSGYTRRPERSSRHDDVTVLGCPALNQLGGDALIGGALDFRHKAEATFKLAGSSSPEVSERLYSDTPEKLSKGTKKIFDAMTGCPRYQVLVGGTAVDMTTRKTTAPALGDEQWSRLLTFSVGGRDTVLQQVAIRDRGVLLVLSGAPVLVDRHLDNAFAKATAAR